MKNGWVHKALSRIPCHLPSKIVGGKSRRPLKGAISFLSSTSLSLHVLSPGHSQRRSSEQPPRPLWTPRSFPDPTPTPAGIPADQMKGIKRVLDSLRPEVGSWLHHSSVKIAWANHFPSKIVTLMSVHLLGKLQKVHWMHAVHLAFGKWAVCVRWQLVSSQPRFQKVPHINAQSFTPPFFLSLLSWARLWDSSPSEISRHAVAEAATRCGIWWSLVSELRSREPLAWESFPGDRGSAALECSPGVWVAPVPTETREEEWGMSSGQHPELEEEQVPNKSRGSGEKKGKRDRRRSHHHSWSRWAVGNGQTEEPGLSVLKLVEQGSHP